MMLSVAASNQEIRRPLMQGAAGFEVQEKNTNPKLLKPKP